MIKIIATLFCLAYVPPPVHAAECKAALEPAGVRPDKKTLGPGALLVVKANLVRLDFGDRGQIITVPTDAIKAYAPEVPLFSTTTYVLKPGHQMRTLTKMRRRHQVKEVRVVLLPGGEEAVMYWTDVYYNTLVVAAGEALPAKVTPVRRKFPGKCQRDSSLWAAGQNGWGRPFAELGQAVWSANHSRAMGRGSVGTLRSIDGPNAPTRIRSFVRRSRRTD